MIKKFGMSDSKVISAPMETNGNLDSDASGNMVDQKLYRSMIGSLLYVTASRPESYLKATKRILKYLKHTPNVGLWYPKGAKFEQVGYSDSDYAGCKVERKSTSGTCQLLIT